MRQKKRDTTCVFRKLFLCVLSFLLFIVIATPSYSLPVNSIGHIQTKKGTALILRGGDTVSAEIGGGVFRGDLVRTAKDGAVGIILTDDTTLSMGPNSEIVIKDYVFEPKEAKYGVLVRMIRGTFVYLSGLIGKLAPDSIRLEIPDATISVRGTKLLVDIKE